MRIVTQPDGFIEVFENDQRVAYVDNDHLFLVGSGAPLGEIHDRSDIARLIAESRTK